MGADQSIIVDVGVVNHYPTGGVDAVIAYNGDNAIRAVGYSEITDVVNDGKVNWLTCARDDNCDVKNCDLAIHEDTFANDFVWANEVEDGQYVHIFDEDEIVVETSPTTKKKQTATVTTVMEDEDILLRRFLFHYNFFNKSENIDSI